MKTKASFLLSLLYTAALVVTPSYGHAASSVRRATTTIPEAPQGQAEEQRIYAPRKLQIILNTANNFIAQTDPLLLRVGALVAMVVALTIGTVLVAFAVA